MNAIDDLNNDFFLPEIEQEPSRLEHMITYITEDCYKIEFDKKILKTAAKIQIKVTPGSSFEIEELTKFIVQNIELFKPYVNSSSLWVTIAIKMTITGLPNECFKLFLNRTVNLMKMNA